MEDSSNIVKIKKLYNSNTTLLDMYHLLSGLEVKFSKAYVSKSNEFAVHCNSPNDVDKLFSEESKTKLGEQHCLPIILPIQKSKRTIILKNCDVNIYNEIETDIQREIMLKNDGIEAVDVFKFPNSKSIKITLATLEMVRKVFESGLKLFYLSVSKHSIIADTFIALKMCYKCYEIDTHNTSSCDKGRDFKICSLCSSDQHTYRVCNQLNIRKCVNCKGEHSTVSSSCPIRKAKITAKRKELTNRSTYSNISTYSGAVKNVQKLPSLENDQSECIKTVKYIHYYFTARDQCKKSLQPTSNSNLTKSCN